MDLASGQTGEQMVKFKINGTTIIINGAVIIPEGINSVIYAKNGKEVPIDIRAK